MIEKMFGAKKIKYQKIYNLQKRVFLNYVSPMKIAIHVLTEMCMLKFSDINVSGLSKFRRAVGLSSVFDIEEWQYGMQYLGSVLIHVRQIWIQAIGDN